MIDLKDKIRKLKTSSDTATAEQVSINYVKRLYILKITNELLFHFVLIKTSCISIGVAYRAGIGEYMARKA